MRTSKNLIKKLSSIAEEYQVKAIFRKASPWYAGYYHGDKKTITVVVRDSISTTVTTFFHELSHVLEHRDGYYSNYYKRGQTLTVRRRLALRAERHTDKRGKKLCKKHFPKVVFKLNYQTKEQVKFLKEWYSDGRLQ